MVQHGLLHMEHCAFLKFRNSAHAEEEKITNGYMEASPFYFGYSQAARLR